MTSGHSSGSTAEPEAPRATDLHGRAGAPGDRRRAGGVGGAHRARLGGDPRDAAADRALARRARPAPHRALSDLHTGPPHTTAGKVADAGARVNPAPPALILPLG